MYTPGTVASADHAEFRFPPPPTTDDLSCWVALIEYTSAVVPALTSEDAAREVTEPMTLSFCGCATVTDWVASAKTLTALSDAWSYFVVAAAVIVYVSGLSEMNE